MNPWEEFVSISQRQIQQVNSDLVKEKPEKHIIELSITVLRQLYCVRQVIKRKEAQTGAKKINVPTSLFWVPLLSRSKDPCGSRRLLEFAYYSSVILWGHKERIGIKTFWVSIKNMYNVKETKFVKCERATRDRPNDLFGSASRQQTTL